MVDASVWTFLVAVTLLTMAPGSDTMLVFRSVLTRGQTAGFLTALGICCGLFVHATLSALGLSVLLVRSALAYEVVQSLGAAYLIGLGIWTIIQTVRQSPSDGRNEGSLPTSTSTPLSAWQAFSEGIVNNVLNPKAAIFYLAFLPQFIRPTDPVLLKSLLLAGIHWVIGIIWLTLLIFAMGKLRMWVTRADVRQKLEGTTGIILIGLGVRLALERRT